MVFKIVVADNFHYGDETENNELGTFESLELAREVAKRIVERSLAATYKPGMSAAELYDRYTSFGEDPYIVAVGSSGKLFSAWTYARERCEAMCAQGRQ